MYKAQQAFNKVFANLDEAISWVEDRRKVIEAAGLSIAEIRLTTNHPVKEGDEATYMAFIHGDRTEGMPDIAPQPVN